MSVKQMSIVWDLDLAPNKRLVLLAYADHADEDGEHVYPSLARVAHKTGYSRDQVRRISRELVTDGLMELVKKSAGKGDPHRYRLTLNNGSKLQPFKPGKAPNSAVDEVADDPSPVGAPMPPEPSVEPPGVEEFANAHSSSGKPQSEHVVGLEKYVTDRIYTAMLEAGYRLPNEHFTYHLGRAQDMLAKDDPTDAELEGLPAAFVRLWEIRGKADAPAALMEMRRQKGREEVLKASREEREAERPPWESPNPQGERAGEFARKSRPAAVYLAFYPDLEEQAVKNWIAEGLSDEEILEKCDAA